MSRSPLHRLTTALMAAWFAVSMTVAVPLHRCPMHDGLMGTLAVSAPGAMSTPGAQGSAQHDGAPAHGGDHPHQHERCTCVGMCACCQAPAMVVAARVALVMHASVRRLGSPLAPAAAPVVPFPHRLPFANGPPPAASHALVA